MKLVLSLAFDENEKHRPLLITIGESSIELNPDNGVAHVQLSDSDTRVYMSTAPIEDTENLKKQLQDMSVECDKQREAARDWREQAQSANAELSMRPPRSKELDLHAPGT